MITRCPNCAAQVSEEAERCPFCQWDFAAKSRASAARLSTSGKPPAAPPPPSSTPESGPGLRQLPKIEGLKKAQPKPDESPFALPTFEAPKEGPRPASSPSPGSFDLPPAKSLSRTPAPETETPAMRAPLETEGPPMTEIRSKALAAPAPNGTRQPPAPLPGRAPAQLPPVKRRSSGLPWMIAAAALLSAGGYGAFKLVTQETDEVGGKLSGQLRFTEGSDTVRVDASRLIAAAQKALTAAEPQRDIAQIQRVAVDPTSPNAVIHVPQGATAVAPAASLPPVPQPPAPLAPPPAARLAPPPAPTPTPSALPMHKPAAQAPGKPVEVPEAPLREAAPKPALWIFEGHIYDLVTLSPVFDAEITLRDVSGKSAATTTTGEGGRYRLAVEAWPQGYRATVKHPDYQDKLLDEIDPPYREVDRRSRLLAASAGGRPKPWIGKVSGPVRRDFVMIPKILPDR